MTNIIIPNLQNVNQNEEKPHTDMKEALRFLSKAYQPILIREIVYNCIESIETFFTIFLKH